MDTLNLVQLLADRLRIEIPPVGMAFVQEKPEDIAPLYRDPPSFCSLWRLAELRVFYASAEQHDGCGIGGVVSGFSPSDGREDELALLLTELCEVEVGTTEEIAQTARFEPSGGGVIYGPLWKMPVEPDLALMWATLPQMGVVQEIVGKIMWRNNPQGAVVHASGVWSAPHSARESEDGAVPGLHRYAALHGDTGAPVPGCDAPVAATEAGTGPGVQGRHRRAAGALRGAAVRRVSAQGDRRRSFT